MICGMALTLPVLAALPPVSLLPVVFPSPAVIVSPIIVPLAALPGGFPGVALGVPLLLAASLVFAATHHESPAAIGRATLQWIAWLGGILGGVLVVVTVLGWFS